MIPTFNTKEEYLAWRAQWRTRYKALSLAIRNQKWKHAWHCRIEQRMPNDNAYWIATPERRAEIRTEVEQAVLGPSYERWKALSWSSVQKMQAEARQMLVWRKQSKVRAQELYEAEHRACSAPV